MMVSENPVVDVEAAKWGANLLAAAKTSKLNNAQARSRKADSVLRSLSDIGGAIEIAAKRIIEEPTYRAPVASPVVVKEEQSVLIQNAIEKHNTREAEAQTKRDTAKQPSLVPIFMTVLSKHVADRDVVLSLRACKFYMLNPAFPYKFKASALPVLVRLIDINSLADAAKINPLSAKDEAILHGFWEQVSENVSKLSLMALDRTEDDRILRSTSDTNKKKVVLRANVDSPILLKGPVEIIISTEETIALVGVNAPTAEEVSRISNRLYKVGVSLIGIPIRAVKAKASKAVRESEKARQEVVALRVYKKAGLTGYCSPVRVNTPDSNGAWFAVLPVSAKIKSAILPEDFNLSGEAAPLDAIDHKNEEYKRQMKITSIRNRRLAFEAKHSDLLKEISQTEWKIASLEDQSKKLRLKFQDRTGLLPSAREARIQQMTKDETRKEISGLKNVEEILRIRHMWEATFTAVMLIRHDYQKIRGLIKLENKTLTDLQDRLYEEKMKALNPSITAAQIKESIPRIKAIVMKGKDPSADEQAETNIVPLKGKSKEVDVFAQEEPGVTKRKRGRPRKVA